MILGVEEVGRDLYSPLESGQRIRCTAEPAEHEPQPIVRDGHRRIDPHGALVLGLRGVQIVRAFGREALLIVSSGDGAPSCGRTWSGDASIAASTTRTIGSFYRLSTASREPRAAGCGLRDADYEPGQPYKKRRTGFAPPGA